MTHDDEEKIESLLATLWQRQLPLLQERLDLLDRTAAEASAGSISEASRNEALSVAHKLAGSLGMFGYHQGTETARTIELILKAPTRDTLPDLACLAKNLRAILQPRA